MTELRLLMHISPQSSFLIGKAILSLVLFLLYLWLLISASFWLHSQSWAWQSSERCYSVCSYFWHSYVWMLDLVVMIRFYVIICSLKKETEKTHCNTLLSLFTSCTRCLPLLGYLFLSVPLFLHIMFLMYFLFALYLSQLAFLFLLSWRKPRIDMPFTFNFNFYFYMEQS